MFASRNLSIHLARGAIGASALALSVTCAEQAPWLLALTLPMALIALRGCPMCWTVGLVETVVAKRQGRPSDACVDGSCAIARLHTAPRGRA
jgi:hypothetical protein